MGIVEQAQPAWKYQGLQAEIQSLDVKTDFCSAYPFLSHPNSKNDELLSLQYQG